MPFVSASCRKISWRTSWLIYSLSKHGSGKWALWGDLGPIFRGPIFPCRIMEGSVYAAKYADQRKTALPSQSWFWKNSWKKPSEYYPTWVQMIVEKGRPPNMEGYQVTWLILVYPDDFHSERHGGSSGDWPAHSMHIIRTRGHLHLIVVM